MVAFTRRQTSRCDASPVRTHWVHARSPSRVIASEAVRLRDEPSYHLERSEKYLGARDSLPQDLRDMHRQMVAGYSFHTAGKYGLG